MTNLHRAYGPPGTGKTTWLSKQCWVATSRYGQRGVAVASLTRAAAQEVAGRDTGLHRSMVGTLHAHAYRALDHPALAETPEGIREWNERAPLVLRLSAGASRDPEWAAPEQVATGSDGDRLLAELMVRRARMQPVPTGGATPLSRFADLWQRWKDETGRLDFTDLIERCLHEGIAGPDVEVFMLDEAQDMSALEMSLALQWGGEAAELVIVGDPDQNLYHWRGSDPHVFTEAEAASERTLSQSYRVPRAVHAYAVDWIERIEDRPPIAYEPRDADGELRELLAASYFDPSPIAAELELWVRSHRDRRFQPPEASHAHVEEAPSAMVLASCAYMLDPLIGQLRERGIPFHNPYRPTNGRWNPMRAARRLHALLDPPAQGRFWTWNELHAAFEPLDVKKAGLARGVKGHVDGMAKMPRTAGADPGERPASVEFLTTMFADSACALAFGSGDLDWYERCLLDRHRSALALPLAAARQGRLEEPCVIVGTIHSVKGGEASRVYVLPDLSRAAYWGDETGRGWAEGERDAVRRQFYVAFTRARDELVLCGAAGSMAIELPRA